MLLVPATLTHSSLNKIKREKTKRVGIITCPTFLLLIKPIRMQKSCVQVWVNDLTSKQINVTSSTTCEDIIKLIAALHNIPKRASQHLELHAVHNGKGNQVPIFIFFNHTRPDHSTVPREEKILGHLQSLAEAGLKIDEISNKNKYVLVVNHDALKKAQKHSGHGKSSWSPLSYFKKRSGIGRSVSFLQFILFFPYHSF
jgi:hypothetical protein